MKIAIFGGSFNPPCNNHLKIIESVINRFDGMVVVPCGLREDKPSVGIVDGENRKEMARIAFEGTPKVQLDCFDLETVGLTPTYFLQQRYEIFLPGAQIWHIVGGDLVTGGRFQDSEIHRIWHRGYEIWDNLNFTIIARAGYDLERKYLPPHSELVEIKNIGGSSTTVRSRVAQGESIDDLVPPGIAKYIREHKLYLKQ